MAFALRIVPYPLRIPPPEMPSAREAQISGSAIDITSEMTYTLPREVTPVVSTNFIQYLKNLPSYQNQITHVEHIPAREPRYGHLEAPLPEPLRHALQQTGVSDLYAHQAQAVNAIRDGHNVVVTTSTASGKTLCYNLPVLEALLGDSRARALYLFPTKALAQDQLRGLRNLTSRAVPGLKFGTYDGDTPRSSRGRLRRSASIILTNPDMLHLGILPNHRLWSQFLSRLRFVVVDEAHVYRGVFGSHVACVLRRLWRLCERYDSRPLLICCSATIANPDEHIQTLTGFPALVIAQDGSPQGGKDFVLWNPPFIDEKRGARRSANVEATGLFTELVRHGLRNITFARARKVAELILRYSQEALREESPELLGLVKAYRAGYLPQERRQIEQELFEGKLLGVTATNALELGVDIGSLDATVLVGYPGTIASMWQQAGRAGRGVKHSLSFLVALENPLDQYFVRHPEQLFGVTPENALLDPSNVYLLEKHLPCAAYELPLTRRDEKLFGPGFAEAIANLERTGKVESHLNRWFCLPPGYPAQEVSIRSVSSDSFLLLDESQDYRLLEEIEAAMAHYRIHPGAIYLHQGESYLVTRLDLDTRTAYARPVDVDYYTQPQDTNEVRIIRSLKSQQFRSARGHYGRLQVTEQVTGYRRKQQFTDTVLGEEWLDLPPQSFVTMGLWFDVPPRAINEIRRRRLDLHGGLHAAEHACIGILPLFAMCDRQDIGGLSTPGHPDTGRPQIFIYDGFPGGAGIAEKGFTLLPELWAATLRTVQECPCEDGCPSCVHSPKCGSNNQPLDKRAAVLILATLLQP
jgi:DEAD/DEAH box helicase domain-containing protein